jgi:lipopolysaccharide/colanic/teichoic acid biosynthesis glycosyltransferase
MSAEHSNDSTEGFYGRYGKRIFDLLLSIPSLVILSPVFLASAILIKLETPGPVTFSQERIGKGKRVFKLYKFRTMVKDASRMGPPVTKANDARITNVGKLLRKFKVDEMLQIINVIKGDMSVVGPRPEIKKYVDMFQADYEQVLRIKPGMTDYALIAFRNEEEILSTFHDVEEGYIQEVLPEKITLYKKYIAEMGFSTDIRIFFRTIWAILRR